ncbi:MAG: PepSY domain-containing protein, partial [Solimonas sp.]
MEGRLYGMLWRWHFLAALIVIPFVLWQSTTGTLYLWSEWWVDQHHPELRFVEGAGPSAPVSAQLVAALAAAPHDFRASSAPAGHEGHEHGAKPSDAGSAAPGNHGPPVLEVVLPGDARRSTTVLLGSESGLPYPIFVDPYT